MTLQLSRIKNQLPLSYRWIRGNGVKRLVPWHFCDDQERIDLLRREYGLEMDGTSDILPFAERQDRDDVAGFIVVDGMVQDRVLEVHLTWKGSRDMYWLEPGTQPLPLDLNQFPTFQRWFSATMLPDFFEWADEDNLQEVMSGKWRSD